MAFCAYIWDEGRVFEALGLYMAVLFRGTMGRATGERLRNNGRAGGTMGSRMPGYPGVRGQVSGEGGG